MPYVGQKPADIISTAVDTVTGTFSGDIDASTVNATGDTAAGDNAAIGFTSAEGLILTGQGSTNDVTIKNDADADVIEIPTGTVNVTMAGTLGVIGAVTANAGVVVDEMTLDADTLTATDDFIIDAVGDITLDADGGDIFFKDAGTTIAEFTNNDSDFELKVAVQDKDIRFRGNDGGVAINALKLDMSAGGAATLNNGLTLTDGNLVVASGHGIDFSANSNAGGMTSELLDSYEEGTFTPTLALSGATLASTGGTGRYTKIGRHVYVEGKVTRNTADGGAGSFVQLESLPFTSLNANSISEMGSGTMWMDEGGPGAGQGDTVGHALVASNGNVASVLRGTSSGAQTSARYGIGSEFTNGRPIYFNFAYTTA